LYSNNRRVPFPVCHAAFSIQIETWLIYQMFVEDPQHRLKWTAYLEFTHNNEVGDLTWDKVKLTAFL
jgi:hypothetical protein